MTRQQIRNHAKQALMKQHNQFADKRPRAVRRKDVLKSLKVLSREFLTEMATEHAEEQAKSWEVKEPKVIPAPVEAEAAPKTEEQPQKRVLVAGDGALTTLALTAAASLPPKK